MNWKRAMTLILSLGMVLTLLVFSSSAQSETAGLPENVYLKQQSSNTCTLASAAMMLRGRMYLSQNELWASVTENTLKPVAWFDGLAWEFTYKIEGNTMKVAHQSCSGISAASLKKLLDSHPEGVVLYVKSVQHGVLITDYVGDTFYCADPANNCASGRIPLDESYLSVKRGSQAKILSTASAYWYVASYSIASDAPAVSSVSGGNNGVTVTWAAKAGCTKYRVYRKTGSSDWSVIGNTTGTSYVDNTAIVGNSYAYTVQGYNSSKGWGFYSDTGYSIFYAQNPVLTSVTNVNGGAKIKWAASAGAAQYRVFRRTAGGAWERLGTTTSTSFTDKTAISGTTYIYTVRCLSADGKSYTSGYDTAGVSGTYLATPALTGIAAGNSGVTVRWSAVSGAAKYRVYRKSASGWIKLADVTGQSYTDKDAPTGGDVTYTVKCFDSTGWPSGYNTSGISVTYVAAPVLTSVTNVNGGVQIKWLASAGAAQYRVFRKTAGGAWERLGTTTSTSFTDKTAVSGTTYIYTVRCLSSDGKAYTSGYDTAGVSGTYLATPALTSIAVGNSGVTVQWSAVPGAATYRIYRKSASGWTKLADVTGQSYTDKNAPTGGDVTYTVKCFDSTGWPSGYNTSGISVTYVAAPVLTSVTNVNGGAKIKWEASSGAAQYRVFRKTAGGAWERLSTTTATSFTDTTGKSGTTYIYTVRCLSADGKSYTSGYDTAGVSGTYLATPALTSIAVGNSGVTVQWSAVSGAATYRIYRKSTSGWIKLADVTGQSYTDKNAPTGGDVTYTVKCFDSTGWPSGYNTSGISVTYVAAPVLTSVTKVSGGIQIKWSASAGAAQYRVFRRTAGGAWERLGTTTSTSFTDKTAISGTTYIYTVRCLSADGKSYTSGYDTAGKTVVA